MRHTHLTFPELRLQARDAHKLRGYFGHFFRENSPLLHNHWTDGGLRYGYPLVQYKVVDGIPALLGLNEGAELLVELFLKIRELNLDGKIIPLHHKHIQCREVEVGYAEELYRYEFKNLWLALNQQNYKRYRESEEIDRKKILTRILRGNILAVFKGLGIWLEEDQRILCHLSVHERSTKFKNQPMLAFAGEFTTNALLPPWAGLGKAVSRGFGTVRQSS